MFGLLSDLRYAVRNLQRAPGFTFTVVATLALAIGATTAVFSIVDGVLLKSLPYRDAGRLVFLESTNGQGRPMPASAQDVLDYRAQSHSLEDVAAVAYPSAVTLALADRPDVRLSRARVGATFFHVLGVQAQLGRVFAEGEDASTASRVVVLSDAAWRRYFGGDRAVIGRTIQLDGEPTTVVGVAPPSLTYPHRPDIWIPAVWDVGQHPRYRGPGPANAGGELSRGYHSVTAVARLRPGVTPATAERDLAAIASRISREYPEDDASGAYVVPLQDWIIGDVRPALWSMLGAVAFVLLIACANVANLLLVRAAARGPELAVRTALGAGRGAILRQLVAESLVLSVTAAAVGTAIAAWLVDAVRAAGPRLPRLEQVAVDGRVLAFTVAVALATGLLFGLVPALQLERPDASRMLRQARWTTLRGGERLRSTLTVLEVALALVLLVGFGLLARSFERLMHVDPGFRPEQVITFDAALDAHKYQYDAQQIAFADEVTARLQALPGTRSAAVAARRPMDPDPSFDIYVPYTVAGDPPVRPGEETVSAVFPVSPGFFGTMGIELRRGRFFTEAEDRLDGPGAVVINEAMARRAFGSRDPLGKRIVFALSHTFGPGAADSARLQGEVVGVVRDVKLESLAEKPWPAAYVPYRAFPLGATFVLRTQGDPAAVMTRVRAAVNAVDPTAAVYGLGTMEAALGQTLEQPRFYTLLLGAFAAIALLLATIGIYAVMAYLVGQRTREFGIRMALGATYREIAALVLRRGATLVGSGIVLGVFAAVLVTRSIRSLLFGVPALDPPTFLAVIAVLGAAALAGLALPARRATRVDPVRAMQAE